HPVAETAPQLLRGRRVPGQRSYVAANAYLEAMARRRREAGLPALAPAWGAIGDVGALTRDAATAEQLRRRLGDGMMTARQGLDALERYIQRIDDGAPESAAPIIGRFAWSRAFRSLPWLALAPFDRLRAEHAIEGDAQGDGDLRERLRGLSREAAADAILETLRRELGQVLRTPAKDIRADQSLGGLGLDSLMGVELRAALQDRHGLETPMALLAPQSTLEGLSARLAARFASESGAEPPAGAAAPPSAAPPVAGAALDASPGPSELSAADSAHPSAALIAELEERHLGVDRDDPALQAARRAARRRAAG
ncbi:MAG: beta-ketoacyl reductase, partial [Pseudomonadota bacterium]